ncbi:hypothetical protein NEOLEDRAFT_926432 [Neolentinus lepideus HHB14362 ss-1]|uniref:SGNH hydrolase-type esterase domain-containing protein n=1 Tax=Neolentinus lepideus HHB14362 ss-1 TaxID=1314782 RepID=A0A165NMY3_9AGAM|nr:hypothetical protein NEOLEDRAFT_926432 [Neolentinus lepideus HHB14362 ss-1]
MLARVCSLASLGLAALVLNAVPAFSAANDVTLFYDNPLIFYHGRWDASPGTWWASSGFNLVVDNLSSLILNLGPHTTSPLVSLGLSVNYDTVYTFNASAGSNAIPLSNVQTGPNVVRINVEGWQNNRVNLESIVLNPGAVVLPYIPSPLAFQFIGDSLSAGQYLSEGVDQAWPLLTSQYFKAEGTVNAQPGAALADIYAWGNVHGVSYQFFRTEDTGFYSTTDHNYTTPWNFTLDHPKPTHLVIHIGANDASQNVSQALFTQTYMDFIARLRTIYVYQPIFVFTPWGWPAADGSISYYYTGAYQTVVDQRHASGDENIFLVNTTGWVSWEDVFPTNQHPTVEGHQKIAGLFETWLETWGLQAGPFWPSLP